MQSASIAWIWSVRLRAVLAVTSAMAKDWPTMTCQTSTHHFTTATQPVLSQTTACTFSSLPALLAMKMASAHLPTLQGTSPRHTRIVVCRRCPYVGSTQGVGYAERSASGCQHNTRSTCCGIADTVQTSRILQLLSHDHKQSYRTLPQPLLSGHQENCSTIHCLYVAMNLATNASRWKMGFCPSCSLCS